MCDDWRIPKISEKVSDFLAREPSCYGCRWCPQNRQFSLSSFTEKSVFCMNDRNSVTTGASTFWSCNRRIIRRFVKKLSDSFLLSVCLLSLIRLPVTMSSPVRSRSQTPEQHWTRPCGEVTDYEDALFSYYPESRIVESNILETIILEAKLALHHAEGFRNDYINKTFLTSFESHHRMWNQFHLDWLPKRDHMHHKVLGQTVEHSHFGQVDTSKLYKNIYTFLQQIAVGMEQVKKDQQHPPLQEDFSKCSVNLNKLLCELQNLLVTKDMPIPENISSDIMSNDVRNLTNQSKTYRDWLIFREYMNVLEYIIQVLTYVKGPAASS